MAETLLVTVPVFGQIEYTRTGSAGVSVVDFRTASGEGYDACMTINSHVRIWSDSRIIAAETVDVFSLDPMVLHTTVLHQTAA